MHNANFRQLIAVLFAFH